MTNSNNKYVRRTIDEFEIQTKYNGVWECVTTEKTMKQAKQRLKEYRENEPQYCHRIKLKRIKLLGKTWSEVKCYLRSQITVDDANIDKKGNCIVDFEVYSDFSIRGKQVVTEHEVTIEIDDDAIVYCNQGTAYIKKDGTRGVSGS